MYTIIYIFVAFLTLIAVILLWIYYAPYPTMAAYIKEGSAYQKAVTTLKDNPNDSDIETEARKLMKQMSLDEKIHMLSGHSIVQSFRDIVKTRGKRNYNVHPLQAGGCKRLGIPPILFVDGPRGIVSGECTCFPVSVVRASTFDPDLEYRVGKAIAEEAIAQGANYFGGVCINLLRNPRWGRAQETYGEDQFMLGEFGASLTRSIQEEGIIACVKHFALNSIEDLRFAIDAQADERTLHEVYLPHFKKCVDAGALSIMGAYNKVNGTYACENSVLLKGILRKEWGFKGFVMSDFVKGVHSAEGSLPAGLDVEMMFTMHYAKRKIKRALRQGTILQDDIDQAVVNILFAELSQFPKIKKRDKNVVGSDKNRALALETAEKGIVLLKNEDLLPLSKDTRLMVCGPYADEVNVGDHGSSRVFDKKIVTPLKGLTEEFDSTSTSEGDVAVVCVGSNYKNEGEFFAGMTENPDNKPDDCGGDRRSLHLDSEEVDLIRKLKEEGKRTIVVLYSGAAILTGDWEEWADAIVMNYYSGCEGGTALAHLLSGKANFSGHLPLTIAKNENDYPAFRQIGEKPYEVVYGYYHGYALMDKEQKDVEYPFGFGLSYSTFAMGEQQVSLTEQGDIMVKVSVSNTGMVKGATVVQVYVGSAKSTTGEDRPLRQLKAFRRIELNPHETVLTDLVIPRKELYFRHNHGWVTDNSYNVYIGFDSRDALKHKQTISIL